MITENELENEELDDEVLDEEYEDLEIKHASDDKEEMNLINKNIAEYNELEDSLLSLFGRKKDNGETN